MAVVLTINPTSVDNTIVSELRVIYVVNDQRSLLTRSERKEWTFACLKLIKFGHDSLRFDLAGSRFNDKSSNAVADRRARPRMQKLRVRITARVINKLYRCVYSVRSHLSILLKKSRNVGSFEWS